jgi:hypothetical protein
MKTKLRRLAPLAAGAWFALLAGGLLAPGTARAGCAHYVVARGQAAHDGLPLPGDLELLSERASGDAAGRPHVPPGGPSPCSGMSCSRNPMPPMAPAPSGPLRADLWACLDFAPVPSACPSLAWAAGRRAGRPVHVAFPPERPPRAA